MNADGMQPEDIERVFNLPAFSEAELCGIRYTPTGDDHEPSDLPEVDDDTDPEWDLDDRIYLVG